MIYGDAVSGINCKKMQQNVRREFHMMKDDESFSRLSKMFSLAWHFPSSLMVYFNPTSAISGIKSCCTSGQEVVILQKLLRYTGKPVETMKRMVWNIPACTWCWHNKQIFRFQPKRIVPQTWTCQTSLQSSCTELKGVHFTGCRYERRERRE